MVAVAWGENLYCFRPGSYEGEFAGVHAPLQESGDMLIKSIRNRIKRSEDKRICACWYITLIASVSARVPVSICV